MPPKFRNTNQDIHRAKTLRKTGSMYERLLGNALKETGFKFRRQHPIHPYIVDFACVALKIIIELDGPSHDTSQSYDAKREAYLSSQGWKIIRFSNDQVKDNLEGVVTEITGYVSTGRPAPAPSRKREGDPNVETDL